MFTGTVLALANAYGFEALGIDIKRQRCAVAVDRRPNDDDKQKALSSGAPPMLYWKPPKRTH